jgi:hypothetical protein
VIRGGGTFDEVLKVRRGNCDPVTVFEGGGPTPSPFLGPVCVGGASRYGPGSPSFGSLQRLGVRPDGSGVVFEVNRDVSLGRFGPPLTPEQQGFFLVRADGSGLRRLGPASREPCFLINLNGRSSPWAFGTFQLTYCSLPFSADGRSVVFTDLGPGPGGETAAQVVTLDVATGERRQVTRLPLAQSSIPLLPATGFAEFVDAETLGFYSFANPEGLNPQGQLTAFTVRIDGTGLQTLPAPVAVPGSQVIPQFGVLGGRARLATLVLPGVAVNPNPFFGLKGFFLSVISEVFLVSGRDLLQLTNFGRVDTFGLVLDAKRQRAFFSASADPLGSNPTQDCQLFSTDIFAAARTLRQLTHFRDAIIPHALAGCTAGVRGLGCGLSIAKTAREDPATGTIVFDATCDAFGTNPNGAQLFAVPPDGSGLRVLTHAKGFVSHTDDSVATDLVGNWDYAPAVR